MNSTTDIRTGASIGSIEVPQVLVTIDSQSTMDIDDAVSVEALPNGGFRVLVCIADPTKLVLPGSTEDENAKLLGATVYVRDSAVRKMLPGMISENKGSLVAQQPRKAFVFEMLIDESMAVESFRPTRQSIKVSHRLSYEDIPEILQDSAHACSEVIKAATTLSRGLLAKRRGKGAMALYDLQRLIYMDEEGRLQQLSRREQVVGYILVQELMILTNTQLARYLVQNDVPALFRNHLAKAAAPAAAELASTMETWVKAGAADLEKAQEMFSVMVGAATYGATVRGHYALAEPCYAHGTSPLRRYADLVNLRQLKAHLKGQPFLYDQAYLEALGEELTLKAVERKEERSNGFKQVVRAHASRALERGTLERLADHELVQAIKIGASEQGMPDILTDELCRRLDRSLVTDKITDTLFVALGPSKWPQALRESFAKWVALIPTRAVHLLMHGSQTGYLKDVRVTSSGEGTSFEGKVCVTYEDTPKEFGGTGSRKRDAEQMACTNAVLWLIGADEKVVASLAESGEAKPTIKGNPKGALMELCQKHGWQMPTFVSSGQGPSHAMVFSCEAAVTLDGSTITGVARGASSKKEAEAIASADLLGRIKSSTGSAPSGAKAATSQPASSGNPIGALQEMAQKMKWAAPSYAFTTISEVPPKFRATVTVAGPKSGTYSAEASTKQEAKTQAAKAAMAGQQRSNPAQ